ncbi:uncharacterized protein LOC142165356 [Nicotiana tabacum]|uniref:Uncharacterized protein LOC142165356 n=1 Tax=Nicotiana tabacum TaxID=4097 RepID=A0AC58S4Y0_TOBAC
MAKAYNIANWECICQIMRQMGIYGIWIDRVWRLINNVWYSINLNGTRHGFFKSSRGIKQGHSISPSLFVIGAELLPRLINMLPESGFISYSAEKNGSFITHLCYADDTILFLSVRKSIKKYGFYVSPQLDEDNVNEVKNITGVPRCQFPVQYLGYPIYLGRNKIVHFNNMVAKVSRRLQGWQGKLLSFGGKAVLLKYVLQSLPLHLLYVLYPPKMVLYQIERIISKLFWGKIEDRNKVHWINGHIYAIPPLKEELVLGLYMTLLEPSQLKFGEILEPKRDC